MTGLVGPIAAWWVAATVIGWASVPVVHRLFRHLPDRGLGFARPLGMLAVGYLFWVGGMAGVIPNTASGAAFAVAVLVAVGAWVLLKDDRQAWRFVVGHRRLVVAYEVLFGAVFVLWALYRAAYPNIESSGGEKYMEMAFLNGILASERFPPQDPWLAGASISYYYFGFLMGAHLVRLTGVLPSIGFNLIIPLSLAATVVTLAGLGGNLAALTPGVGPGLRALSAGLAAVMGAVAGNLQGFLEVIYRQGWFAPGFWNWLDIKNLTLREMSGLEGEAAQRIGCGEGQASFAAGGWPDRFIWWWRGSRVIHDDCGEIIHEFPFFSFMLGDVHPHVMALPFTILVAGVGLNVLAGFRDGVPGGPSPSAAGRLWSPDWLWIPFVVGALGFLNAWDLPTYGALVVVAFMLRTVAAGSPRFAGRPVDGITAGLLAGGVLLMVPRVVNAVAAMTNPDAVPGALAAVRATATVLFAGAFAVGGRFLWQEAREERAPAERLLHLLRFGAWLVVLSLALYVPFYVALESQVQGIGVVQLRSRLAQWLVHFGPLTFLAASVIAVNAPKAFGRLVAGQAGRLSVAVAVAAAPLLAFAVFKQAWTAVVLTVLVTAAVVAALETWRAGLEEGETVAARRVAVVFALVCAAMGLALPLAIEFVFLRDLFGSRMNSVFKFYYQAWVLLAIAGSYAPVAVANAAGLLGSRRTAPTGDGDTRSASPDKRHVPEVAPWGVLAALLVAASLLFTVASVRTRTEHWRERGLTLDGLAWWQGSDAGMADLAVADWLRANTPGSAVVVEAPGDSYRDESRISLATGRPTILGWDFHERQWGRDPAEVIEPRKRDLEAIYKSADGAELDRLLGAYSVRYLVVGPRERGKYGLVAADTARFDRNLSRAFAAGDVVVYEVRR